MSREQTKAIRYVHLLDEARCRADWAGVPELVRKVRKHAPKRECLALTAEIEHDVTQITQSRTASSHGIATSSLTKFVPTLLAALQKERDDAEDKFQARACLAWIYWIAGDYTAAVTCIDGSVERAFAQLDGTNKDSVNWTKVCAIRTIYVKGASLERLNAHSQAITVFESGLPILASLDESSNGGAELRLWTELYLTQFCMISSRIMKSTPSAWQEAELLTAFRAWDTFWTNKTNEASPTGGFTHQASVLRRHVWKEYYSVLSIILCNDLPYPTTALSTAHADHTTRRLQRAELKRVESGYERLMLKEVNFPRADQATPEVEEWVHLVMQNWRILSTWSADDLGEDQLKLGRNVLDILYRAATKSFHSTPILRHLFKVHLALADFDLAFKAFDTYFEIVQKGKARVEKTGEKEESLDDDDKMLITISDCIRALCRYGKYDEAVKARTLAQSSRDWLSKYHPEGRSDITADHASRLETTFTVINAKTRAMIWGAIGIAEAHWARCTFDATVRSDIQLEAIRCLGKSLSKEYGYESDVNHLFSLALVFAERRELNSALEVVKSALLPLATHNKSGDYAGKYDRERSLITSWHLLALLLSAKQDFTTATQAAEGAFEQFKGADLFSDENTSTLRSEHLKALEKPLLKPTKGLVDHMDDFEKEALLEVKMTQLALSEIDNGPDEAVNQSDELLSLYARLFWDNKHQMPQATKSRPTAIPIPQSSSGKAHSIKASLFGRKSVRHNNGPPVSGNISQLARPDSSTTLATTTSRTPTIQVTNVGDDHGSIRRHRLLQRGPGSLTRRNRAESGARDRSLSVTRTGTVLPLEPSQPIQFEPQANGHGNHDLPDRTSQIGLAVASDETHDSRVSTSQRHAHQNMYQQETALRPSTADGLQDTRLPRSEGATSSSGTTTRFAQHEQDYRHSAILVKVWLMIAGFYRRATMIEDASASIVEAEKIVQSMQHQVEVEGLGDTPIDVVGWGQRKSVEELWADVLSERGNLALSQSMHHAAIAHYEQALIHYGDHSIAITGLSNLLLDVYTEELLPVSHDPVLQLPTVNGSSAASADALQSRVEATKHSFGFNTPTVLLQTVPLGQPCPVPNHVPHNQPPRLQHVPKSTLNPRSESSTEHMNRLACRDRAYGLLNGLTKLGTGWNNSEAWYALSRAYELSGQPGKQRDSLWWCVELEEGRPVRDWSVLNTGGFAL